MMEKARQAAADCLPHVRAWKLLIPLTLFMVMVATAMTAAVVIGYSDRSYNREGAVMDRCAFSRAELADNPYEAAREGIGAEYNRDAVFAEYMNAAREARQWVSALRDASLRTEPLTASEYDEYLQCQRHPDFFHMYRSMRCTALWVQFTRTATPEALSHVLAVLTTAEFDIGLAADKTLQNGGFQMHFSDGDGSQRGYFKVCSGTKNSDSHEKFAREIVSFHLDRILGFYRVPAVSMRTLDAAHMRSLAAEVDENDSKLSAEMAMQTIVEHCSTEQVIQGASVGWSPFELQLLEHANESKYIDTLISFEPKLMKHQIEKVYGVSSASSPEDLRRPLESMTLLMFTSLTGNVHKVGHNVFAMKQRPEDRERGYYNGSAWHAEKYGPLCYIDNDRASFTRPTPGREAALLCKAYNTPVLPLCIFPKSISLRILALAQHVSLTGQDSSVTCTHLTPPFLRHTCKSTHYKGTTGSLLLDSLSGYRQPIDGPMLDCNDAFVLDENVQWWANHINMCIAQHGAEAVLIDEPWDTAIEP